MNTRTHTAAIMVLSGCVIALASAVVDVKKRVAALERAPDTTQGVYVPCDTDTDCEDKLDAVERYMRYLDRRDMQRAAYGLVPR